MRIATARSMVKRWSDALTIILLTSGLSLGAACGKPQAPAGTDGRARNVVIVTIDTVRADRVGVYGYTSAQTPFIDALARRGTRFDRAYAAAPITLTSHASLMSGRYPPGHGARHNGLRVSGDVPLLAEVFQRAGYKTGAFVGAFPLDRRFGLDRGFHAYGDHMPRKEGVVANERPGRVVVDEALAWLREAGSSQFFLWVHLFEPHAPYGDRHRMDGPLRRGTTMRSRRRIDRRVD